MVWEGNLLNREEYLRNSENRYLFYDFLQIMQDYAGIAGLCGLCGASQIMQFCIRASYQKPCLLKSTPGFTIKQINKGAKELLSWFIHSLDDSSLL